MGIKFNLKCRGDLKGRHLRSGQPQRSKAKACGIKAGHPFAFWLAVFLAAVFMLFFSFYVYIAYLLPLPDLFLQKGNFPASKIYDRSGKLLYEILQPEAGKKTMVPLQNIPKHFINATLASEDINFYSHPGVDFSAIARALFFNLKEQRIVSGGSTITQQLVRNILGLKPERGLTDKLLEAVYAVRISNVYDKDRILELYLNKIYYGNMSYGAQSASLDYFGKNIYDLDLAQSSLIAGLPQSPSRYNPFVHFDRAKKRQKYVLDQMVKNGFASQEEADAAYDEPLTLRANKHKMKAPHFVQYVMNQVEEEYGDDLLINGGLKITTTLDYDLQLKAEGTIGRQVEILKRNNVTNGALVALDTRTGQVLAWVGSADYFNEEIDGSVDMATSLRQPGSSIKPLTYLLAFEKGYTPATIIYDIPTQFNTDTGPYSPKNYDLEYHGPVRARTALASSYNIPAVKTLDFAGITDFIAFLRKLGIETLDKPPNFYGLALTLGGGEVRLIDMANAFNVIANYGVKKPFSTILNISGGGGAGGEAGAGGADGKSLFEWEQPEGEYILGPQGREHAYQIIDILKDPLARIPGFGEGSVLELSRPAAVKTGTTRNFRDNWTIGFTPELLTAVWVGNADATPMQDVSGVDGAAPVWADFMEAAMQGKPRYDFVKPDGLLDVEICALSGKLPTDLCDEKAYEIFVKGTGPKEKDDYYKSFWINSPDGHIVPEDCRNTYPSSQLTQKILIDYPLELNRWATQKGLQLPLTSHCGEPSGYTDGYTDGYADGYAGGYPNEEPEAISIDNPVNNDEYLLESSLPLRDQKIPFRVTVPTSATEVNYYIDGKRAGGTDAAPYTYLWLPVRGRHLLTVEAVFSGGVKSAATVSFTVK